MVWQAAHSHALIVAPFHAPPEMASKGIDGAVVASQVLDKLQAIHASSELHIDASQGYSAEPTQEVNMEIPETGISVGELRRGLKEWLGHDSRISGNLVMNGDLLTLAVRTEEGAKAFTGPPETLDALEQQAAEEIFAQSQPLAFADYLRLAHRTDEATALLKRLVSTGSRESRAWAYLSLGEVLRNQHDLAGAHHAFSEAAELDPKLWRVWEDIADIENFDEHNDEGALASRRQALAATDFGGADPQAARSYQLDDAVYIEEAQGDYAAALKPLIEEAETATDPQLVYHATYYAAYEAAYLHDLALSRAWTQRMTDVAFGTQSQILAMRAARLRAWQLADVEDWAGAANAMLEANANLATSTTYDYWGALLAIYQARAGQVAAAKAIADRLAPTCYYCLVARAIVAETSGDRPAADRLFGQAVRYSPSSVRGYAEWGKAKLARGDTAGAIALFRQANARGPHYADAMVGWGEALMRTGDFPAAARQFKEADRYAPHWGGNHLRWAQALDRLGKSGQAQAQYALAAGLALSAADRAALVSARKPQAG